MATKVSSHSIMKLRDHYGRLQTRLASVKQKGEHGVKKAVEAVEVSAAAFAFGAVEGRYGDVDVVGIPVDLGTGVILHAGAFFGIAGKASDHLHSFANGALASYFHTLGRGVGTKWKGKALTSGAKEKLQGAEGRRLTESELKELST